MTIIVAKTACITAILFFAITACSTEKKASAPEAKCEFQIQKHSTPLFSTYGNDLNIPYNQEKLVQMMWVSSTQTECYSKQFAPVKIYKIPFSEKSGYFNNFKEAPQAVLDSWKKYELSSGSALKGLTTFKFYPGKNEKIVESYILLREDARPWHLWHEFSHFIIGTERAHNHNHNLEIADQLFLEKTKTDLKTWNSDELKYSAQLQKYFDSNQEFITKRFVDEIIIEATLLHLTHQQNKTPDVTLGDVYDALNLIEFFSFQLSTYVSESLSTIQLLKDLHPLTPAQIELLNMYSDRLVVQQKAVGKIQQEVQSLSFFFLTTN